MTTHERHLIEFLKSHLAASDVPNISHSNALIPTLSALLTEQNLFLLLEWIRCLKQKGFTCQESS
ncbi:hypothetical protein ACSBR2_034809 [Camellia fascicularis]